MSDGKKRIGKTAFSAGGALLVLVIVVLVNILLSRTTLRWDATEDNLYSLSQGTRTILSELEQEVVVKVFYSKHVVNTPSHIKTFAQRVLDFLSEYEHFGKGKISVEIYDPKPDSEEEEWAIKYGMKGISLPTGEQVYMGLVALAAVLAYGEAPGLLETLRARVRDGELEGLDRVLADHDRLDVLIHNAGILGRLDTLARQAWGSMYAAGTSRRRAVRLTLRSTRATSRSSSVICTVLMESYYRYDHVDSNPHCDGGQNETSHCRRTR